LTFKPSFQQNLSPQDIPLGGLAIVLTPLNPTSFPYDMERQEFFLYRARILRKLCESGKDLSQSQQAGQYYDIYNPFFTISQRVYFVDHILWNEVIPRSFSDLVLLEGIMDRDIDGQLIINIRSFMRSTLALPLLDSRDH
jgi:hypothetical protein